MPEANQKDLITSRLKLKEVFPDLVDDFGEDATFIRKGVTPAQLEIKEGERAVISYITTNSVDRDKEIVRPAGAILTDYRKNPVVLFGHDYSSLPIGRNMWIKSDEKGLIAKTKYADHEEADKVYEYRKAGFPLAESIGFLPTQAFHAKWTRDGMRWDEKDLSKLKRFGYEAEDLEGVRAVYTKWILLEYSDVAVPANPEATQIAIGKGLIPGETTTESSKLKDMYNEVKDNNDKDCKQSESQELEINIEDGDPCCKGAVEGVECECADCKAEREIDASENVSEKVLELKTGGYFRADGNRLEELIDLGRIPGTLVDCVKDIPDIECKCQECKSALEDLEISIDDDIDEAMSHAVVSGIDSFVDGVKALVDIGVNPDEAVKALSKLQEPLVVIEEIEDVEDEDTFEFAEEKELEFDFDTEEVNQDIKEIVRNSFLEFKKNIKKDTIKTAKDSIDRMKGKIIAQKN